MSRTLPSLNSPIFNMVDSCICPMHEGDPLAAKIRPGWPELTYIAADGPKTLHASCGVANMECTHYRYLRTLLLAEQEAGTADQEDSLKTRLSESDAYPDYEFLTHPDGISLTSSSAPGGEETVVWDSAKPNEYWESLNSVRAVSAGFQLMNRNNGQVRIERRAELFRPAPRLGGVYRLPLTRTSCDRNAMTYSSAS